MRFEMLIVYTVSFSQSIFVVFAGVVKQGKEAAVPALGSDAGDAVLPGLLRGASSLGGGEQRRAGPMGIVV